MSQAAKEFLKKVTANPELKAKCLRLVKEGKKEEIEKIAKQMHCECSYRDLEWEVKSSPAFSKQLTDEELLHVAGGKGHSDSGQHQTLL